MKKRKTSSGEEKALVKVQATDPALQTAVSFWADATTTSSSARRQDIRREKERTVHSFFAMTGKHPAAVSTSDVKAWQIEMENKGLAKTTVYLRISHLSSFYIWAMKDPVLGQQLPVNPVNYARPKAPKPYQTRSVKALTREDASALLEVVKAKGGQGDLTGKRDYALLLLYFATGMRRQEVISLRGREVQFEGVKLIIQSRVKGGDYQEREVSNPLVVAAILDYLGSSRRLHVLRDDGPLWTRHDQAGKPGEPLSSWSFVENLKRYARQAGLGKIHLHQTRHTFARMVAEKAGSLAETQEALGHRHVATTRVYVQRLARKRDKFSRHILGTLGLPEIDADLLSDLLQNLEKED